MSTTPKTDGKPMHYGFAVIGDKIRKAEPAASQDTATARAEKIAEKAGAGKVPTFVVEATSRKEADEAANAMYMEMYPVEAAEETAEENADAAASDAAPAAPAKTSGKAGFYTVAKNSDGETIATPTPERDLETAKGVALPAEFKGSTGEVVVKAKSRDEAINRYEALEGNLPESGVVMGTTRSGGGGGGRKRKALEPITDGDTLDTWKPTENADGNYFVSKSGILHSSADCRFVKADTPKASGKNLVKKVLVNRMTQEGLAKLPKSEDGNVTAHTVCAFCSGTRIKVEADSDKETAAA
jgi:hypothetical protein